MRKKSWRSLISAICLIIIVILLIGGAQFSIRNTQRDVNSQNKKYLSEIAVQNAQSIKKSVNGELDKLEAIANIIGRKDKIDPEYAVQILKTEAERGNFKRLGYIDLQGKAVTTDDQIFSVLDRDYYTQALRGEMTVSDVMTDKIGGGDINVYAVPLYCQGEIRGVIIATNDTKIFSDVLNVRTFYGEGYSYIIKKDGTTVAMGGNSKNCEKFTNLFSEIKKNNVKQSDIEKMREDIEHNDSGVIEYSRDGVEKVGAYSKLGINDWYVMSVVPREVILKEADRLVYRSQVNAIFIAVLLGGLIALIIVQNKKNSSKLMKLAYVDPLTGGNNLNKFKSQATELIGRRIKDLYIVRLDIDNFKFINDMYGYKEGDEILINIYRMILSLLKKEDICARSNNDNFLCLLNCCNDEELLELGREIRDDIKQLLLQKDKKYAVNITTGIYRVPPEEKDIDKMIDRVTMAHRKAKLLSCERKFAFYSADIWEEAVNIKDVEDVMDQALINGEFVVYLQPKYHLHSQEIVGAEALIRWIRKGKVISPAEFLPIFEKNGFIVNLDLYVLEEVCKIQRKFIDMGIQPVPISVNQSKALIYGSDYVAKLSSIVQKYDLPTSLIEFELLESIIHENVDELKLLIDRLQKPGFRVCLDDFGSGYSSLNLIKDICPDVLKIDREFLGSAESSKRGEIVLDNIIKLAERLEMFVVVEGVETRTQAELLKRLKCNVVQGYLFAKPMPLCDYEERLLRRKITSQCEQF